MPVVFPCLKKIGARWFEHAVAGDEELCSGGCEYQQIIAFAMHGIVESEFAATFGAIGDVDGEYVIYRGGVLVFHMHVYYWRYVAIFEDAHVFQSELSSKSFACIFEIFYVMAMPYHTQRIHFAEANAYVNRCREWCQNEYLF